MNEETNFGFERVSKQEKTQRVKDLFRQVAGKYDLMNDLMSFGIHRLWKDHLVSSLELSQNAQVLDVAGGTGDIAFRLKRTYPHLNLNITVCDITPQMVEVGRDRALNNGYIQNSRLDSGIQWVCGNAEELPIRDNYVDLYTISYGLRNVTQVSKALTEAFRVLKPGATFVCLEFSRVKSPVLEYLYNYYSFQFIPFMGEWVANDRKAYQYLVDSIRQFPDQETLTQMIKNAGFQTVNWHNLCGGISCIHIGKK